MTYATSPLSLSHSPSTRSDLYGDVLRSLHEVRQATAASTAKVREKLGLADGRPGSGDAKATDLKADGLMDIQKENAGLNKMVGCCKDSSVVS